MSLGIIPQDSPHPLSTSSKPGYVTLGPRSTGSPRWCGEAAAWTRNVETTARVDVWTETSNGVIGYAAGSGRPWTRPGKQNQGEVGRTFQEQEQNMQRPWGLSILTGTENL